MKLNTKTTELSLQQGIEARCRSESIVRMSITCHEAVILPLKIEPAATCRGHCSVSLDLLAVDVLCDPLF
jgi:hypothetical protein